MQRTAENEEQKKRKRSHIVEINAEQE